MNVLWKQYNMAKTVERGFVDLIKIYEKLKDIGMNEHDIR
jgi:hypothetical protein